MKRICADCGRPMQGRRSCRHCFGIRAVLEDDVPLEDLMPAEDDYSDESDADSVYRESSEMWGRDQ